MVEKCVCVCVCVRKGSGLCNCRCSPMSGLGSCERQRLLGRGPPWNPRCMPTAAHSQRRHACPRHSAQSPLSLYPLPAPTSSSTLSAACSSMPFSTGSVPYLVGGRERFSVGFQLRGRGSGQGSAAGHAEHREQARQVAAANPAPTPPPPSVPHLISNLALSSTSAAGQGAVAWLGRREHCLRILSGPAACTCHMPPLSSSPCLRTACSPFNPMQVAPPPSAHHPQSQAPPGTWQRPRWCQKFCAARGEGGVLAGEWHACSRRPCRGAGRGKGAMVPRYPSGVRLAGAVSLLARHCGHACKAAQLSELFLRAGCRCSPPVQDLPVQSYPACPLPTPGMGQERPRPAPPPPHPPPHSQVGIIAGFGRSLSDLQPQAARATRTEWHTGRQQATAAVQRELPGRAARGPAQPSCTCSGEVTGLGMVTSVLSLQEAEIQGNFNSRGGHGEQWG